MQYRRLGHSGLQVSALSYGSWVTFGTQMDVAGAEKFLGTCFDAGINFFDNAEGYNRGESETIMGAALRKLKRPRDSFCVSSKVFFGSAQEPTPTQRGLSRKHVFDACHGALERLQVDYLDLYFCHRPDPETPIEETVRAMHDLVSQGKVMYWGTSEWSAQEITQAWGIAQRWGLTPPTMEQPQYNLLDRRRVEREYGRLYEEIGLGTTIWSPLASGMLTGKYLDGIPKDSRAALPDYGWLRRFMLEGERGEKRLAQVKRLQKVADQAGMPLTQLSIAWCLKNPNVSTVILGASKLEQLQANLQALDLVDQIDDDLMKHLDQALNG